MAKLEQKLIGDFDQIIKLIEDGIKCGIPSAALASWSDFSDGDSRCAVRVFDKYSYVDESKLSFSVTLFQKANGPIHLSAITAGGNQVEWLKINRSGEKELLDKLKEITFNFQQSKWDGLLFYGGPI